MIFQFKFPQIPRLVTKKRQAVLYSYYHYRAEYFSAVKEMEFYGAYGNERKKVKLTAPTGAAGLWQVLIDNFYYGVLIKRNNRWVGHMNGDLTADDIMILGDLIDEHFT